MPTPDALASLDDTGTLEPPDSCAETGTTRMAREQSATTPRTRAFDQRLRRLLKGRLTETFTLSASLGLKFWDERNKMSAGELSAIQSAPLSL
ncbi:hypothetical protein NSPZN2_11065 [Nitrospira defluvii]|uniref:Uncharacterized protein n=1 Tax=Nitrospira defluvii TaxID=330214 RepID=A0ABM8QP79_9BACT|nr:hypothetical protein NSPZN2_11065 [Nitrospira defluvii]